VLYEFAMTPDLFDASVANSDGRASIILVELLRGIAENAYRQTSIRIGGYVM